MTPNPKLDLAELKRLEAAASKAPWKTHLVDDTTVISGEIEVCTTCDSVNGEREDGYNINYERMELDAAFIVALRNTASELIAAAEREAAFKNALSCVVNMQSNVGRASIREFAAEALKGHTASLSDQSPEATLASLRAKLAIAEQALEPFAQPNPAKATYWGLEMRDVDRARAALDAIRAERPLPIA